MKLLTVFFGLVSLYCSPQENDTNPKVDLTDRSEKILIVYLSRTNNTKAIAEIIHGNVGGTLVALELVKPYPEDYKAILNKLRMKMKQTSYLH